VALLGLLRAALAESPATRPADPKDVFRTFLLDLEHGNPRELAGLCVADTKESADLLGDFQAVADAVGELRVVVSQKFGAKFADSVLPRLPSADDVEDMDENINGDRAALSGESVSSVQLMRTGSGWKIDLDWLVRSPDMPANPRWYAEMAQVIRRTAGDIASGRLDSPQAAIEALRARENGIPDDSPATEPTSRP
jgi:hypothetical protein